MQMNWTGGFALTPTPLPLGEGLFSPGPLGEGGRRACPSSIVRGELSEEEWHLRLRIDRNRQLLDGLLQLLQRF